MYQETSKDKTNLFEDFKKLENMQYLPAKRKQIKNKMLKTFRKIHLSDKINHILKLPFKSIWYDLSKINLNNKDNYVILMLPSLFFDYDISVIRKWGKRKNVKLVLILLDTVGVNTPVGRIIDKIYQDKMWDYIFTYDLEDAKKYQFIYLNEHYYSKPNLEQKDKTDYDAYFFGALKPGRTEELIRLYETFEKNDVHARFDVVKNNGHEIQYESKNFTLLDVRQPYHDILKKTIHTNCIVEFLQKSQQAQSLRYFEAVIFNKKLLTTNQNIKNLSFYDERYMKIFEKFEEIDFEWVKRKEEIDYHYKDEFSPLYMIKKIEELEEIKEKK